MKTTVKLHGGPSAFARLTGLELHEINRWLKTLPSTHESLLRWATALGLPWTEIVTAQDNSAANKAKPKRVPPNVERPSVAQHR